MGRASGTGASSAGGPSTSEASRTSSTSRAGRASASSAARSWASRPALSTTGTMPTRSAPSTADNMAAPDDVASATRSPARSPRACRAPATRRWASSERACGEQLHQPAKKTSATPWYSAGSTSLGAPTPSCEGDPHDLTGLQGHHRAEGAVVDGVDGGDAEAGGQHPVEGRGGAAALDVTEDGHARLEPGARLDLLGQRLADAPQAHVAEGVDLARHRGHGALDGRGPLGHHHDGGEVAHVVARLQGVAHRVEVEGLLGDQDHGGAAGDARPQGDVPGVTAHDLDHHHPVVRLGGGVEPVDGLGGDLDRGVEAEGLLGGAAGRCRWSWAPPRRRCPGRGACRPRPGCRHRRWR